MISISELRRRTQTHGIEDPILRFYRRFTIYLSYVLIPTGISANQVTFLSLVIALISLGFLATGIFKFQVIGAFFYLFAYILDFVDGEIARHRQVFTKMGVWLDVISHNLIYPFTFFAIGVGVTIAEGEMIYLVLGAWAGMFKIIQRMEAVQYYVTYVMPEEKKVAQSSGGEIGQPTAPIYNYKTFLLTIQGFPILSPVITACALLSRLDYFLWFYAVYNSLIYAGIITTQYLNVRAMDKKNDKI